MKSLPTCARPRGWEHASTRHSANQFDFERSELTWSFEGNRITRRAGIAKGRPSSPVGPGFASQVSSELSAR